MFKPHLKAILKTCSENSYITVPIIIFCLIFWGCTNLIEHYNRNWQDQHLVNLNKIGLAQSQHLERHIDKTMSAAYILGSIVKHHQGQVDQFETYAKDIYKSIGGISCLQLSPNGIIEKIYPLERHEKASGHNIIQNDTRKKEALLAIQSKQLTLAGPFQLIQGGTAIIGRYPIFLETLNDSESFWGFSTVLIYLDDLLNAVGIQENDKFEFQIARTHPDTIKREVFYGQKILTGLVSSQFKINVPNGEWFLKVKAKTISDEPPLQNFSVVIALILSAVCATCTFLLMKQPKLLSELVEDKTAQLKKLALFDSLTGLANRHGFEHHAEKLITSTKNDGREHVLCYMDLDQFKVINDTCGHIAGDELLRQLCQVLKKTARKSDTLYRMGGDEFGLLIEDCSLENAGHVAESVREAVQGFLFIWKDRVFRIGISIGMAAINSDVKDQAELLSRADTACYIAKDSGRNRIHIHYADDIQTVQRHHEMQWVTKIHHALEKNLLCLFAQPIISINDNTYHGYELLIRMRDNQGNLVMPGAFLPSAERYNLMEKLDGWVISTALKKIASAPTLLNKIDYFSINLSGQLLSNTKFLDFIIDEIKANNISGTKICFEITETAAISNLNNALKFITTLKAIQCKFALDDFGSGLSSFGYLKDLPVDYLKIDGMFVTDIVNDPIDHAIVKSINEIGQLMEIQTIAEYVENDNIKTELKKIGVNYVQGYGVGKPIDLNELL